MSDSSGAQAPPPGQPGGAHSPQQQPAPRPGGGLPARRLSNQELEAVIRRAVEILAAAGTPDEGISEAEVIRIGQELGLDPEELGGSAWTAALASFLLFALGAVLPVLPFALLSGWTAVLASVGLSAGGLFVLGAAITLLTGRSAWLSGGRQLLFGLAAAAVTFGLGRLLGVSLSG